MQTTGYAPCTILIVLRASGADVQAAAPAFEVVSVKVATTDGLAGCGPNCSRELTPPGHYSVRNVTLRDVITEAFDIADYQIAGAPGWLDSERYYIDARTRDPAVPQAS